jgi:GT2 family glycosyltransferase
MAMRWFDLVVGFFSFARKNGARAAVRTALGTIAHWMLGLSGQPATLETRLRQLEQSNRAFEQYRTGASGDLNHCRRALLAHADSLRNLTWLGSSRDPSLAHASLKVSVIVAVHNRARRVEASIDSVLAQSYANVELIVVDDGSTDDIETTAARYQDHPKIRFLRIEHGGAARARNTGLRASTGDILLYLDSDNRMYPGYLDALAAAYANTPDAQCALAAMLWDDGDVMVHLRRDRFDWDGLIAQRVSVDANCFSHRRSLWLQLGGWDESLTKHADYELALRYTQNHPPTRVDALAVHYDNSSRHERISTSHASGPNMARIYARYQTPIDRPLKVLIFCFDYPQLSESYVDTEIAWMTRRGVDVEVCSIDTPGAVGQAAVHVHRHGLAQAIRTCEPDLIHCHWLPIVDEVAALARAQRIPVTVRGHGFEFSALDLERCDSHDVARSIYLFPHFAQTHSTRSARLYGVPACFDSERFYPRHGQDRRMVLRAAACLETKDIETFFHVARACPQFRFVLALATISSLPQLPAHFENLNALLGHPVEIRWNVPAEEMAKLTARAGVYLHTFGFAQAFGMPVSIAESMACGAVPLLRDCPESRVYAGGGALYYNTPQEAIQHLEAVAEWSESQWRAQSVHNADFAYARYADEIVLQPILRDWLELTVATTARTRIRNLVTATP